MAKGSPEALNPHGERLQIGHLYQMQGRDLTMVK